MRGVRLPVLLKGIAPGPVPDVEVGGIAVDSRAVRPGDLFVAIRGEKSDGHDFLSRAAEAGAAAALVDREGDFPLPSARVPSTAASLPAVAVAFHGDPSARLRVVGVTGTNGKTTVTWILESIFRAAGILPAVMGTISYRVGGEVLSKGLTTPFPHDLQRFLAEALAKGAGAVAMEVSSHAAEQGRIAGVRFDAALFTNLTRDHLDYHGDMESYFESKARLFRSYLPAGGKKVGMAVNGDDPYGSRLAAEFPGAVTFGFGTGCAVTPREISSGLSGSAFRLASPWGELSLRTSLVGRHNVANVMTAACGALLLGLPKGAVEEGVASCAAVPGRMEAVPNDRGLHVFVDYAHTPDGLERVLSVPREVGAGRLVTVFGCGGNRDRGKRPLMGAIAARLSDVVVATSDNPRNEEPGAILRDVVEGIRGEGMEEGREGAPLPPRYYRVEPDRRSAIALALSLAGEGDTVVIAGKGHEDVQIVGDRTLPFDDRAVARELLAARR